MKLLLPNVRLSFPDLWEAVQFQGAGPFNYRVTLLIPEASPLRKQIDKAILDVAKEKWKEKAEKVLAAANAPGGLGTCFNDGNNKEYDGYADHWFLAATRPQDKGRPAIIDRDKSPLAASDGRPYGGCYVNASVEIWAQDNKWGKSVRAGILGVQFSKDGDSFGGGAAVSVDDFENLGMDAEDGTSEFA